MLGKQYGHQFKLILTHMRKIACAIDNHRLSRTRRRGQDIFVFLTFHYHSCLKCIHIFIKVIDNDQVHHYDNTVNNYSPLVHFKLSSWHFEVLYGRCASLRHFGSLSISFSTRGPCHF